MGEGSNDATGELDLEVPERFNYTADVVETWAKREPDRLALVAVGPDGSLTGRFTFREIAGAASRAASLFAGLGIGKGDRVLIQLPRIPEWYPVMLGLFRVGAVPMPATTQLTEKDIAYRLDAATATAVVTDGEGLPKVDALGATCASLQHKIAVGTTAPGWVSFDEAVAGGEPYTVPPDTASDDPLLVYFTSGTTGMPKMVLHTHASLGIGHEITARYWHGLTADDLHWTVSDFGWAKAAWGKLFGQWRVGTALFLWNIVGPPDYAKMLELIGEYGVTSFCAPPTIYRVLVQHDLTKYDWSKLRHCTSAGEPLNPEVIKAWSTATGQSIYDGYGQTETVCLVANRPGTTIKPGSMGKPMPGFEVAIVDHEGVEVADGEEGSIAVKLDPRPVGLFREYWRAPERNAESFRNGWYYTGDRAYRDEDGYVWFVGRDDDVIISAGYRIGPFEVESALIEHPAVVEAAVVAKPDDVRGEIVKAYVVLVAGQEPSPELARELQDHVKKTTAPYKYPREVEFTELLPKTISGKIRRVELREQERNR